MLGDHRILHIACMHSACMHIHYTYMYAYTSIHCTFVVSIIKDKYIVHST
jgi:hypothetical protein